MNKIVSSLLKYLIILGLPTLIAGVTLFWLRNLIFSPPTLSESKIVFEIFPNESFRDVTTNLGKRGVIKSPFTLLVLGKIKELDKSIQVGEYEIKESLSIAEALKVLSEKKTVQRKVTIPEGSTLIQIANAFDQSGVVSKEVLLPNFSKASYIEKLGIPSDSLEGYLFPNTYFFAKGTSPETIIQQLAREGASQWSQYFSDRAEELGFTRHEVITLASIIERESGNVEEQPKISSVFHNRIKAGMKLQSDPTVIYGLKDFNGNITKADLLNPHPYNTYVHTGLPPGPICSPGLSAIKAALTPVESENLYFVSNNEGSHVFTKTYPEHQQAVTQFQKSKTVVTNP
jgi:UPF0755 protein